MTPTLPFFLLRSTDRFGPVPNLGNTTAAAAMTDASPFLIWRWVSNMNQRRIILFDLDRYISDPSLIFEVPYLLALAMMPFFLLKLRSNVAAQFILGVTLVTLFGVMFNPVITPLIGSMAVPWLIWRFHWLIPFALTIAFGFDAILQGVIKVLTFLPGLTRARKLLLATCRWS